MTGSVCSKTTLSPNLVRSFSMVHRNLAYEWGDATSRIVQEDGLAVTYYVFPNLIRKSSLEFAS